MTGFIRIVFSCFLPMFLTFLNRPKNDRDTDPNTPHSRLRPENGPALNYAYCPIEFASSRTFKLCVTWESLDPCFSIRPYSAILPLDGKMTLYCSTFVSFGKVFKNVSRGMLLYPNLHSICFPPQRIFTSIPRNMSFGTTGGPIAHFLMYFCTAHESKTEDE